MKFPWDIAADNVHAAWRDALGWLLCRETLVLTLPHAIEIRSYR